MIIFQVLFGIIMLLAMSSCETSDGVILGFCIWFIISFLVFFINKKGKQVTREQKIRDKKRFIYSEVYYNNYGELP